MVHSSHFLSPLSLACDGGTGPPTAAPPSGCHTSSDHASSSATPPPTTAPPRPVAVLLPAAPPPPTVVLRAGADSWASVWRGSGNTVYAVREREQRPRSEGAGAVAVAPVGEMWRRSSGRWCRRAPGWARQARSRILIFLIIFRLTKANIQPPPKNASLTEALARRRMGKLPPKIHFDRLQNIFL